MACLQGLGRFRHVIRSGHSRRRNRRWQGFALFEADIAIKDGKIAEIGSVSGAELLFEVFSQRYERGSTLVTSNLPFDEWTEVFGSERLTGALLDRLTHHVHILEMNGESYRLNQSRKWRKSPKMPD